jgi:adenylate kinase
VLVKYYTQWAAGGDADAPRYRKVEGVGTVDEIKQRVFAALT